MSSGRAPSAAHAAGNVNPYPYPSASAPPPGVSANQGARPAAFERGTCLSASFSTTTPRVSYPGSAPRRLLAQQVPVMFSTTTPRVSYPGSAPRRLLAQQVPVMFSTTTPRVSYPGSAPRRRLAQQVPVMFSTTTPRVCYPGSACRLRWGLRMGCLPERGMQVHRSTLAVAGSASQWRHRWC